MFKFLSNLTKIKKTGYIYPIRYKFTPDCKIKNKLYTESLNYYLIHPEWFFNKVKNKINIKQIWDQDIKIKNPKDKFNYKPLNNIYIKKNK